VRLHVSTVGWLQDFLHERISEDPLFVYPDVMPGGRTLEERITIEVQRRLFHLGADDDPFPY